MYTDHPYCEIPEPNTIIWRYMNIQKFESLLEKNALFFAKPRYLNDPFEGRYPASYKRNEGASFNRGGFNQMPFNRGPNYLSDSIKDSTFVCCFTTNEYENDSMWKSYLMDEEGVAIQSTFKQLRDSFEETEDETINIGIVKYYDKNFDGETNPLKLLLQKRVFYNNEKELRAIMTKISGKREIIEEGIFIPIKIKNFINKVVLSPKSDKSFEESIKFLCSQKGLDNIVYRSKLEETPKW